MSRKLPRHHFFADLVLVFVVITSAVLIIFRFTGARVLSSQSGYDEFGYNYQATNFSGPADGVDRALDGTVWGDPAYGADHLVMKWSKAWDAARFAGAPWTCDAWTSNEWNGKKPGGSGEIWHYKIVWVGPQLQSSPCWRPGGSPIWGQFEVIMSQGTVANQHFWDIHAAAPGYGMAD